MDRAFRNDLWYEAFSFTHVQLLTQGLSDHTPLSLHFPPLPKLKTIFLFCDI